MGETEKDRQTDRQTDRDREVRDREAPQKRTSTTQMQSQDHHFTLHKATLSSDEKR